MTRKTRLAPSPTGALHLGNARTFIATWALAKQRGWRVVLRIDDLDSPRVKKGADSEAIDILRWLGLDWDEGPVYETDSLEEYSRQLQRLADQGLVYPCTCTRKQIAAASLSAPHAGEHELRYPGTCRPEQPTPFSISSFPPGNVAWRLRVPDETISFDDKFAGLREINVQRQVGDFLVTNKEGVAAYQLACVVDDSLAGMTDVIRGDDLLDSTPRQILLARMLGIPPVGYWHLPIVVGEDGHRLAKRHGDTTIASYRRGGVSQSRLLGLIGDWCGFGCRQETDSAGFLSSFSMERMPRDRVVFSESDHQWLISG